MRLHFLQHFLVYNEYKIQQMNTLTLKKYIYASFSTFLSIPFAN